MPDNHLAIHSFDQWHERQRKNHRDTRRRLDHARLRRGAARQTATAQNTVGALQRPRRAKSAKTAKVGRRFADQSRCRAMDLNRGPSKSLTSFSGRMLISFLVPRRFKDDHGYDNWIF
jgi:hypothetical protein